MSAYSTRFVLETVPSAGDSDAYTVPAGFVAIIQHIDGLPASLTPDQLQVVIAVGVMTVTPVVLNYCSGQNAQYVGKLVMNAGDKLQLFPNFQEWFVQVSGALLPTT